MKSIQKLLWPFKCHILFTIVQQNTFFTNVTKCFLSGDYSVYDSLGDTSTPVSLLDMLADIHIKVCESGDHF